MELKNAALRILDQLSNLINELSDKDFNQPLIILNNATLGQHIRHTLEFFICLQDGLDEGKINYDKRRHDKAIETDRILSLSKIQEIVQFLSNSHGNKNLVLELVYGDTENDTHQIDSNFARELAYNIEHGVHHMAIVKIGALALRPTLQLPVDFGVASSTIRYRNNQAKSAV